MSQLAKRYTLVVAKGKTFLCSNSSASILKALVGGSHYSYDELSGATGMNVHSLYVFCQRLEVQGLIKRTTSVSGSPKRTRTIIKIAKGAITFPNLCVIR